MPETNGDDLAPLVRTIQTIALFIGMGNGHVSDEEMEWLDEEAPGFIRHCLRARPAIRAFLDGADAEAINALVPNTVEHTLSVGMLFGGPPPWAAEALEKRAELGDLTTYEFKFAAQIDDPIDQIISHYFALRMLTFSGEPAEGEIKAYGIMIGAWSGGEIDSELLGRLMMTAKELLPNLLGLDPPSADNL